MRDKVKHPNRRPPWFQPLALFWAATGLPAALVVPYFWITGTSPTESPPLITSTGQWMIEVASWLLACVYIFGSPLLLVFTELRYRRRVRLLEEMNPNASN